MTVILPTLLKGFAGIRVLVVGDVMLDCFVYGRSDRMSPEAPVPILAVGHEDRMAGGAGNVARNIAALGGLAHIIGVIGNDQAGSELRGILTDGTGAFGSGASGISAELIAIEGRRTTKKTRFICAQQQLLRVDEEDTGAVDDPAIAKAVAARLDWADIVILSDYAKGLLTPTTLKDIISKARAAGKRVIVDPKSANTERYDGAFLLTPNRGEATLASGIAGEDDENTAKAAAILLKSAPGLDGVLVTRGARGMTLAARGEAPAHFPTSAREVFDVSGAGDTVVATLALGLGAGCSLHEAVSAANHAAGLAVAKAGTAVVTFGELIGALEEDNVRGVSAKIVNLQQALEQVAKWRAKGQRIGFTNGCFDLVHPGHISLLAQARAACQHLIVGINTDASVRRLKGPERPLQTQTARALVMAAMQPVDLVVLFDEDTPLELIRAIRPDVIVKGADYRPDQVVGADFIKAYGGEVLLAKLIEGESTTRTISKMGVR
jgi:D-beta-D-heptose 7-phosphate kinase/D-beta-D-heptose 1-phosphate adenosyltransferase